MKKNIVKISLDIIMFFLLFLLYKKNAISMSFHELGGLIVWGLFLIHIGLNWKWIVGVSKKLFDKSLPAKTRIGYIVDVLLLITMSFIIISGIMISKVIFTRISGAGVFWKFGHFFAAAIAIILVGIHIGLHWSFIKNIFAKILKFPPAIAKPLGIICLALILIYGGYNITTSNFTRWLNRPFIALTNPKGGIPPKGERHGGIRERGVQRSEGFVRPDGKRVRPREFSENRSLSLKRTLGVITSYGSIAAFFSALTVLGEKVIKMNNIN
ncbi:MAG TPA: DUF4405 domain-containing protein [Bacillota bacterium]